jgi:hypothetical protein
MGDPAFTGGCKAARLVRHLCPSWDDEKTLGEVGSARFALPSSRTDSTSFDLTSIKNYVERRIGTNSRLAAFLVVRNDWSHPGEESAEPFLDSSENPLARFENKTTLKRLLKDIGDRFENFLGILIHRNGSSEVLIFHD